MTADETTPITPEPPVFEAETPAPEPVFHKVGPLAALKMSGDDVQANLSAMGSVQAGSLSATGSAIGAASIDGDATITASMVPALLTRGNTTVQQSYASAVIVGGGANTKVHQAASPLIIGKTMDISQSGACALVTGEADVKSSWVGIVLSPKTIVSEDSHVIVSTKAALIIALALFGGLGLVALALTIGVRRVMQWRPTINVPGIASLPALPNLAMLQEKWQHIRDAAA
jgi:hypothetical protein